MRGSKTAPEGSMFWDLGGELEKPENRQELNGPQPTPKARARQ